MSLSAPSVATSSAKTSLSSDDRVDKLETQFSGLRDQLSEVLSLLQPKPSTASDKHDYKGTAADHATEFYKITRLSFKLSALSTHAVSSVLATRTAYADSKRLTLLEAPPIHPQSFLSVRPGIRGSIWPH